nr:T9SS type A sorting domain-containing protein [Bacteroidota bacterium]
MNKHILNTAIFILIFKLSFAQFFPVGGYQGGTLGNDLPVQTIQLSQGWNGISSYLNPENPEVDYLCSDIENKLIILYNPAGMYWPDEGVNTLNYWNTHSSYAVKVSGAATLQIKGTFIDYRDIYLQSGWRYLPVLCSDPVDVATLFAGITQLTIVKSIAGNGIYWPEYNINQLNNLQPGKGYYVKMNGNNTITFPESTDQMPNQVSYNENLVVSPWNRVVTTNSSHTIAFIERAVELFEEDDMIGVFTSSGLCAGVIRVVDEEQALAVNCFADDPLTAIVDGLSSNEPLNFRLYRQNSGETFEMIATYASIGNQGQFAEHGISVISDLKLQPLGINSNGPESVRLLPNPTTGLVNIEGVKGETVLVFYNAFGNPIRSQTLDSSSTIDLMDFPKGIYLVQITTSNGVRFDKLVVN